MRTQALDRVSRGASRESRAADCIGYPRHIGRDIRPLAHEQVDANRMEVAIGRAE